MYYIVGNGLIIESLESSPSQDYLATLADECELDELWVIEGQHSGITYERTELPEKIPPLYPSCQPSRPAFKWDN